jgi:shikimate dehydrogenase
MAGFARGAAAMITGRARLAGVMGWPVAHSRSPLLHGFWFERYGIDGAYVPLAVRPEDVGLAFDALPRMGFLGWNVTLPHKEAAFRLVHRRDAMAERMGAVNTVLVQADGTLEGRNTDGLGFLANLRAQAPDWRPEAGLAVLIGAGGAARGVAVALLEAGVPALRLLNRTAGRAELLRRELAACTDRPIETVAWEGRAAALEGTALLVQCTSLGMAGQPPLELDLAGLPGKAVVADLVYTPLDTDLLASARRRGNPVVDGLGMLLHQAVPGFAHWGGVTPAIDEAVRAVALGG